MALNTSSKIHIQLATLNQASALAAMSRDLIEKGLSWRWRAPKIQTMMLHPEVVVICALNDSGIVGFAIMEFHRDSAHLNLLAVKSTSRRKGVGKTLVEWLLKSVRVAGVARIVLEVRGGNWVARKFYESLGFELGDLIKGYYDGREDAYKMVLQVVDPAINARRS